MPFWALEEEVAGLPLVAGAEPLERVRFWRVSVTPGRIWKKRLEPEEVRVPVVVALVMVVLRLMILVVVILRVSVHLRVTRPPPRRACSRAVSKVASVQLSTVPSARAWGVGRGRSRAARRAGKNRPGVMVLGSVVLITSWGADISRCAGRGYTGGGGKLLETFCVGGFGGGAGAVEVFEVGVLFELFEEGGDDVRLHFFAGDFQADFVAQLVEGDGFSGDDLDEFKDMDADGGGDDPADFTGVEFEGGVFEGGVGLAAGEDVFPLAAAGVLVFGELEHEGGEIFVLAGALEGGFRFAPFFSFGFAGDFCTGFGVAGGEEDMLGLGHFGALEFGLVGLVERQDIFFGDLDFAVEFAFHEGFTGGAVEDLPGEVFAGESEGYELAIERGF